MPDASPFQLQLNNHSFDLSHGFLPKNDPITTLPSACEVWEQTALALPKLLAGDMTRHVINDLPAFALNSLATPAQLERAMMLLSYLGHAYVWLSEKEISTHIPANLAKAWVSVAKKLNRPPVLSYASYALYNWRRLDHKRPIELGNIALLQNFLGGIDEEWFILIHIDIEQQAIPALQALIPTQVAINNQHCDSVVDGFSEIKTALENICQTMRRMPERCDPYIYYNRVRPYIHGWKDNPALPHGLIYEGQFNNEPQQWKGETGAQSAIIPTLDGFFNIKHADNPLKKHLNQMRDYMPAQHRLFLETVEQGPDCRQFVIKNKDNIKLTALYNECLQLIYNFREIHFKYAAQYIQKQAQSSLANPTEIGTGGTPFMDYLKKHRDETKSLLIK